MSADQTMRPRPAHLVAFHERQREAALDELRPMLLEAHRLRDEDGLTWEQAAQVLRERGFVGRSGQPISGPALYLAARRYPL